MKLQTTSLKNQRRPNLNQAEQLVERAHPVKLANGLIGLGLAAVSAGAEQQSTLGIQMLGLHV